MNETPVASATAYSYIRFSYRKQEEGDSIRRQTDLSAAWAGRQKVHLDTSLKPDRGVSAFRGKNHDLGALGEFLRLVDKGRVAPGSYLVVESLDRLTREEIQPALLLVLSLIQKGIKVVQLKPAEMVYDAKSDTTAIILMLVELSRGHSESKVKSERVSESWGQRRKAARESGAVLTRSLPAWIEERDGKLFAIPERAAAIRRIFELSVSGLGTYAISKRLTEDKVPAFGPSGRWSVAYLHLLLNDRRALGEFQPRVQDVDDGKPIPDYFPRVVSDETWERARAGTINRHRRPGKIGERVNLFAGLLKSAKDGSAYRIGGISPKNPYPVLMSTGHMLGKGPRDSFPLAVFERAVLSELKELDPHEILNGETRDESLDLANDLARVEASISAINAEMDEHGESPSLFKRLRDKEARQRTLSAQLAEARRKGAHPLSESWGETSSLLDTLAGAPDNREARLRLREALRRIVVEMRMLVVPRKRDRFAVVQLYFSAGAHGVQCRDYLIFSRQALSAGGGGVHTVKRPATWGVASLAATVPLTRRDLRKPEDVKAVEKWLSAVDVQKLVTAIAAKGKRP